MAQSLEPSPTGSIALNTTVEHDFVSPLTAVRGALEILRDFPDLGLEERQQFVETALKGCSRLQDGVDRLAKSVYQAARKEALTDGGDTVTEESEQASEMLARIRFLAEKNIVEIDFSNLTFQNAEMVNEFYDVLDAKVEATQHKWYFLVKDDGRSVWPEAWVAFAHRGKKVDKTYSLGMVHYTDCGNDVDTRISSVDPAGSDQCRSREEGLQRIAEMQA